LAARRAQSAADQPSADVDMSVPAASVVPESTAGQVRGFTPYCSMGKALISNIREKTGVIAVRLGLAVPSANLR
jgi:hypothetical protein